MFKIESYITPLLMGYVDKYVKLRPEDFQLSLWGGDAVLNNLDLRLDMIERAIQMPIAFKSGYIHELRIHVPWTKLGSEPVVLTINTVECILKLRETAYGDSKSRASGELRRSRSAQFKQRPRKQDSEDLPPGYLQSLINKVMNNVSIIINNLIIKFVEDDIVLSLNVKSAECYSVDSAWNRAFVELSPPELVLRKAINFCDLTVCLDKCDASGKIENYQDPLIYRCSVNGRMYMKYDSVNSKIPAITKFDVFCEKLDISFTDAQLPMFFRLVELCIALYYGTKEFPSAPESESSHISTEETAKEDEKPEDQNQENVEGEGWMNWAWSYVPQILPSGEEELGQGEVTEKKKPAPSVLSIGMYAHKATITFKLTEKIKGKVHYGPEKISFKPFMYLEGEGIALEILMMGITFFDAQFGISNIHLQSQGNCVCGMADETDERSKTILKGGSDLQDKILNYYSQSLFDIGCPANHGQPLNFLFDWNQHLQTVTEQAAMERYGVFFVDYLYCMQEPEEKVTHSTSRSSISEPEDSVFLKENSLIRYIVGSCHYNVSSSAVHRIQKFLYFMYNHSYEPYSKTQEEIVDDNRPHPTEEQMAEMEECLPTRTSHLTILEPIITMYFAQHPQCDVKKKSYRSPNKTRKGSNESSGSSKVDVASLPCVLLAASRFDLQVTSAMYPRKLVRLVSKIAGPSSNLLHHCHSHTQMKLFAASVGLMKLDQSGGRSHPVTMVPAFSGALYKRYLLLPMYWSDSHFSRFEQTYELPQASVNISKANVMLLTQIVLSWQQKTPKPTIFSEDSLLSDVFGDKNKTLNSIPMIEVVISGVELRKCKTSSATSSTGTLSSLQAFLYDGRSRSATPLLCGPVDTTKLHSTEFFTQPANYTEDKNDFVTFTYQFPKDQEIADVPGCFLLNIEGFVGALDPSLMEWFSYTPVQKFKVQRQESHVFIDLDLAKVASPILKDGSRASSGGSVTQKTGSIGHTFSQAETSTNAKTISQKKVSQQEGSQQSEPQQDIWSKKLTEIFPSLRALHVQVEMKSFCLFVSQTSLTLSDPSTYIPENYITSLTNGTCPETLVVCLPHVRVHSSGMKPTSAIQDIPIHSMEGSIRGEKLPWTMQLENFSVYTVHDKNRVFSLLKPVTVSCTIAVTSKYNPPTSNTLSALALCLHTDMRAITLSCSKYQVNLCTDLATQMMRLLQRVMSLYKGLFSIKTEKNTCPSTPTKLSKENVETRPVRSASIIEDVLLTETETSGGLTSRETTPSQDLELEGYSKDRVRLSLWLQWTLPKFEVKFYKYDELSLEETKVLLLLEDLTMSLDIQEVYAKVKVTCGSCNANHFHRPCDQSDKIGKSWKDGKFMGILVNSRKQISDDIQILSNKHWSIDGHPSPQTSSLPNEESTSRDKTHGFLNFTLTRALCKNVAKRIRKLNADLASFQEMEGDGMTYDLYFHKYITELCLDVEPCDFVLYFPAVQTILDSFKITKMEGKRREKIMTPVTLASNPSPLKLSHDRKPAMPLLTSSVLPLLYVNIKNVRVFIPNTDPDETQGQDDLGHTENVDQDKGNESEHVAKQQINSSALNHDIIVGLIHSICINPQAENPLPRYAIEKDLYHKAMQLRLTQQPGSAIENRQYQVDIKGCALCSGSWSDFVEKTCTQRQQESNASKVQFPALEWNTMLKPFEEEKEPIRLLPLVSNMDMRVVAAPPIVYIPKEQANYNKVLVCGYSLEVNVTNKLDLYISTNQIHLLEKLINQSAATLISKSVSRQQELPNQRTEDRGNKSTISVDSGIESEASTSKGLQNAIQISVPNTVTSLEQGQSSHDFTPFDILLTANVITCTFYSRKTMGLDTHGTKTEKPSKTQLELKPEIHVSETQGQSSERKLLAKSNCCNVPFLYLYFSQPHTVLSCQRDGQKFEMSCYDVLIKGSQHQYLLINENKVLPEWSDFGLFWIESRPGQPHQKTGIPPSLYTLQVTDFLQSSACVQLKLERPVKVNLSMDKVQKTKDFVSEILPPKSKMKNRDKNMGTELKTPVKPKEDSLQATLAKIRRVDIVTDQIVVSMDTGSEVKNCGVIGCVNGSRLEVELQHKDAVRTEEMSVFFYLNNTVLSTVYQNKTRTLIGPSSINLNADLQFYDDAEHPLELPRATVTMTSEYVNVVFGQENVMCLTSFFEHMKNSALLKSEKQSFTGAKEDKENQGERRGHKKSDEIEIVERSRDDIRTGKFQYIMYPDNCMVSPKPGEIIFCNQDDNNDSSMTWCYNLPRVISHVQFTPIPFNMPEDQSFTEENKLLVPCVLQYYDVTTRQFMDYVEFELSENCDTILQMPDLKPHNIREIIVAKMWRILIRHSKLMETEQNNSCNVEGTPEFMIIILPASLAASIKVDSCYVPSLIPTVQLYFAVSQIDLRLNNHFRYLGKGVPGKLHPFVFDGAEPDDKEFAVVTLKNSSILASHLRKRFANTYLQVSCDASLQVVEHKSLTIQNVIRPFGMYGSISHTPGVQSNIIESNITVEPMFVRFGKGIIHTLNCSAEAWNQMNHSSPSQLDHVVMNQYVICNDTNSFIRFGQVGTDENLRLGPREMHCYSWRTHKTTQHMHLCLDGKVWKWCEPFGIDTDGTVVRVIKMFDYQSTIIVYIKQLSNVQKQIIIRGQLIIASRLSLDMELKISTSVPGSEVTELNSDLSSEHATPSYVLEPEQIKCVKIRMKGLPEKGWSKEVHVTGERLKENRMVKVAVSQDKFIHVWCRVICQHLKDASQTIVLLCPLYVIRSHLPRSLVVHMETTKVKEHHQMEVPGQGRELQLKCLGADFTHSLSFQLSQGIEKSTSAVTLSAGLIDQVERTKIENVDVECLTTMWKKSSAETWPYCFSEKMKDQDCVDSDTLSPGSSDEHTTTQNSNTLETVLSQPSLNLHINLSEYWPECSTLLIDVYPWCLMSNQSDVDLIVIETNGTTWQLPSGKTFTPPKFDDTFKLALIHDGNLHETSVIPLSEEEVDLQRYRPDKGKTLYLDGYVQTKIDVKSEGKHTVYFLTLQSTVKDKMRIITIRETYCVTNFCSTLMATLHCIPLTQKKVNASHNSSVNIPSHTSCKAGQSDIFSLLCWKVAGGNLDNKPPDQEVTYVNYISLKFAELQKHSKIDNDQSADNGDLVSDWSLPTRLIANEAGSRVTMAVPLRNGFLQTKPVCITGFTRNGVVYYTIRYDRSPVCLLHNKTSYPVIYGHQNPSVIATSVHIQEETELINGLPTLHSYCNTFYTPAIINEKFPDSVGDRKLPKMAFGIDPSQLSASSKDASGTLPNIHWSAPVDINADMECFVPIPECIDIKVKVQNIAMVTHVTVEPISKAEVSAKEVRSRISGKDTVTMTMPKEKVASENLSGENINPSELSHVTPREVKKDVKKSPTVQFCVGLHFQHLCFVLQDETSSAEEIMEILQITVDDLFLGHLPSSKKHSADQDQHTCLSVCVGNLQIDNQQYFTRGLYDFPVLLICQESVAKSKGQGPDVQGLNVIEKLAVIKSFSFAHVQIVMETDCLGNSVIKSLEIGTQPAAVNLDDNFVFRILKEIEGLIPTKLSYSKHMYPGVKTLPKSFKSLSAASCDPIKIGHLCVHPMSMLFSVHASLKVFIASDRTPLSFGKFDKKEVCTTTHHLVRVLAMHYASGALFRAGIVVGSLEILGNPTGLVRSIGTGVADLIKMPYSGLTKGPGAFVSGISSGMSSFARNISSGMITSVTKFASSVSRNMDRLSLDDSHKVRQEERRRQQPDGISSGLKQGLTGFGMSLLGAIAGLADQPIQNIIANQDNSERPSRLSPATGIVKGVGKGIVGVFTKPIGGAAELVSQTGQGLLQGTGLAGNLPGPRYVAENFAVSAANNSRVKYTVKYLQSLLSTELINSFHADFLDLLENEVKVELVLTNELLIVMNCEEDSQEQAFSLTDLEISNRPGNILTLIWKDSQHDQYSNQTYDEENKDRVEEYIDGTLGYVKVSPPSTPPVPLDSQSDSSSPCRRVAESPKYHYILDPTVRSTFVAQFNLLQNGLNGRGFVV